MTDMLEPNPINYPAFNDFFTRALKPGVRPVINEAKAIASPVDGKIWQIGKADDNALISAKGKSFTLGQLLADNEEAKRFSGGNFAVLYLSPSDYHRIHMPIRGKLCSMRYIPGKLFSVSPSVVDHIPDVFAKNERVVLAFDTAFGAMAMVLVGAIIVGSVETTWAGVVMPNKQKEIVGWDYTNQEMNFDRGLEIASFKLGSTVILLFPEGKMQWEQELQKNAQIKMGQSLGKF